jgi:hypothetical protein
MRRAAFNPNFEAEWRQASLPDVEGGIPAARKERRVGRGRWRDSVRVFYPCGFFRRAGKPGSTAGSDARRYGSASEFRFKPIAFLLALVAALAGNSVSAIAQTNSGPAPAPFNIGPSPVQQFRELLTVSDQEREDRITLHPPGMREPIEAKVRAYLELPADERELRLQATELRYYLLLLLPMTNWSMVVTQIAEPMRTVVNDRLVEWQVMPPPMREDLIANERVISYFSQLGTLSPAQRKALVDGMPAEQLTKLETDIAAWRARPEPQRRQMFAQFNQLFTLNPEERAKALSYLSEAEREAMQATLDSFAGLSAEKRLVCIRSFEKFANMSLVERQEFLKKADAWRRMTPAERAQWRKVVQAVPELPPLPPGMDASIAISDRPGRVNKVAPPTGKMTNGG